jgi:hypothetical protein
MSIMERFRRFLRRQSDATQDTQSERLDAMVKAQERDKRV